jgi:hypothetical protein
MRVDTGRLRVVSPEASGTDLPGIDTEEGPPSPGRYIAEHRERQDMSIEQLAAATKIPKSQLELLEADRYGDLSGPVFVKGFLRCCARSLQLDEQTVLGLLYEQEREKLKARRRDASGPISGPVNTIVAAESSGLWPRFVARVADPRLIMWIIVALIVAVIVTVAFTLASAQTGISQS